MSQVNFKQIIALLEEFTLKTRNKLEVILAGGLAIQYYGMQKRATVDLDAEVKGDIENLISFLKSKGIPADLGENISRWSVIDLVPGYRKRALPLKKNKLLTVKVLSPIDIIISKLGRFTEQDIKDALFVTRKFRIKPQDIQNAADKAIANSPRDTVLFLFKKNIKIFLKEIQKI
ncbi:MAG TPA: hypothetical protein DHV62_10725 [Elusimicrobia bacterium]|nr:hypothetical protein [Elusimicrobiota bacterium]